MNAVIEKNQVKQATALIALGYAVGKGDRAQAVKQAEIIISCLDDYEAEIARLEAELEQARKGK